MGGFATGEEYQALAAFWTPIPTCLPPPPPPPMHAERNRSVHEPPAPWATGTHSATAQAAAGAAVEVVAAVGSHHAREIMGGYSACDFPFQPPAGQQLAIVLPAIIDVVAVGV